MFQVLWLMCDVYALSVRVWYTQLNQQAQIICLKKLFLYQRLQSLYKSLYLAGVLNNF